MIALWASVRETFGSVTTWGFLILILSLIVGLSVKVWQLTKVKEGLKKKLQALHEELESWHRDVLTNVLSRRMWLEEFRRAFAVAHRYRFPGSAADRSLADEGDATKRRGENGHPHEDPARCLTLVSIDIDHFKKVNDTYGHDIGDVVLRKVGELLNLVSRPSDLVGRPGGEEFAAALATDAFGGQAFVKRLRKLLAMQQFIAADGTTFNVTISAGIVQLALRETTPEKLVKRADELLYEAKRSGRNRYAVQECDGVHMYEH